MQEQKNLNTAFEKKLTSYEKKPQEGAQFIVRKNLKQLIPLILNDINQFTHTNQVKYKSLCQLQHTIVVAEGHIQPYLEQIVKTVGKFFDHEEQNIQKSCQIISELVGLYINVEIYAPLFITLFQDEESKNCPKYLGNLLTMFSLMIQNEKPNTIEPQLQQIIDILSKFENSYQENEEILYSLHLIAKNLIHIAGESIAIYCRQLFTILLTVQATTKFGRSNFESINEIMMDLAKVCGYTSVSDLHANEVSILLEEFTQNKSYQEWNKFSRDRFKFDVIVRNCKEGIYKFMPTIIEIIQFNSNRDAEVEIKIDMLVLIEFLFGQDKLANTLKEYSVQLLQKVLVPSIIWKIGKTQTRTRKAGVINIIKMIDNDLIDSKGMMECIKDILPPIKTCLDDDWAPDLRYATCNLIERVFKLVREDIKYENIFEFYTALLERLDDAQDAIRMEITKSIMVFFSFPCLKISPSIVEYTVKAVFIHLDDQNEEIQNAMFNCLKFASRFTPKLILEEAQAAQTKMKYPRRATELVNISQEYLNDSSNQ